MLNSLILILLVLFYPRINNDNIDKILYNEEINGDVDVSVKQKPPEKNTILEDTADQEDIDFILDKAAASDAGSAIDEIYR